MASSSKDGMDFQFIINNARGAVQQLVSIVPDSGKHLQDKVDALELLSESINKELAKIKDMVCPSKPPYWTKTAGIHVIPDSKRIDEMQRLLTQTWREKRTRDRPKGEEVPTGARVTNVLRVENHESYEKYMTHAATVQHRRGRCERFHVETNPLGPLEAYIDLNDDLNRDINEMYLCHGTKPQDAIAIAESGFLLAKAGSAKGTMFGPGIYLAENASKSDEYAHEGADIYAGQWALLLCRAVGGHVLTVTEKGDHSRQIREGGYDSLCGDRRAAVGTFREIVLFNEAAVYTEFIILYSRCFDLPAPAPDPTHAAGAPRVAALGLRGATPGPAALDQAKARADLESAVKGRDLKALKEALEAGTRAGLRPAELQEAEEARDQALQRQTYTSLSLSLSLYIYIYMIIYIYTHIYT